MPRRKKAVSYPSQPVVELPEEGELTQEQLKELKRRVIVAAAASLDSFEGFAEFFEYMHGSPLHEEGKLWVKNAYEAHREGKGLLQECHRESGKTTVFSKFFLAFRIGKEPWKINAVIRINDQKANETTAAVANIIANDPRWKEIFPHVVPDYDRGWGAEGYFVKVVDPKVTEADWAKIKTEGPDGPTFVGYGWSSGSIIGSRFNGCVIVDDIHDEENTRSGRQLAQVKKWYTDTFQYCLMKGVWEVWNYTPWVYNDVYAYLKGTEQYRISQSPVMKPAMEEEKGATFWEKEDGQPLSGRWWKLSWPDMFDFARIASKYALSGAMGFARMMLLDLEATKGNELKADWLHEYPASEIKVSWPVFMGVDYASTADRMKDKDRDFFALAVYRAIPGGGIVLVDGHKARVSKGEALDVVVSFWQMYPTCQRIGVENIGKGEEFFNDLLLVRDAIGRIIPLMPVSHGRRSKGERFQNWLAPRFQSSRIWISDAPGMFLQDFRNEWLLWPNAEHDDCLDGAYMGAVAAEGHIPSEAKRTAGDPSATRGVPKHPAVAFGRH
jgi:hypothetical protein